MTGRSDQAVEGALGAVLRDHGWDVATRARRLRGSLNDVLGADADEHRAAVDAVVLAVEEGIVTDLVALGREGAEDALPALAARLAAWGLADAPAAWAVRAWTAHLPPSTIQPPDTRPQGPEPTTLPPSATSPEVDVTMAPPVPAPAAPPARMGPTVLPSTGGPAPGPASRRRPSRRALAVTGVAAVVLAGGVATAVAMSGDTPEPRPPSSTGTSASRATETPPTAAEPGDLLPADDARVPVTPTRLAMAARTGGVRVARLGEVDSVGSGDRARSAPDGGRLLAFRLTNWACASESCRPWERLGLTLDVDGTTRALPRGTDTFAVAVPAGATKLDLVMKADGFTQTLSLLHGRPGADNIAVLARPDRVDRVGARFTMSEHTTEAFNYAGVDRTTVPRDVTVDRAELIWFAGKYHPSSPRSAFLKVRSHYTIPVDSDPGRQYGFDAREMVFVARDGTRYRARDLDDGERGVNTVFEVPAGLVGGTLVLGGDSYPTQFAGLSFTRTLSSRSVPLRFG